MSADALTKRQRQILWLMREADGPVMILGGTRKFFWGKPLDPDHPGALVIKAYGEPDLFLMRRGLIAQAPTNAPGRWWRLTDRGLRCVLAMKVNPL